MLAWLEVGNGVVMIRRGGAHRHHLHSHLETGRTTAMRNVCVDNIDAHYALAVGDGAHIVADLQDLFWGDRCSEALDPAASLALRRPPLKHARATRGGCAPQRRRAAPYN